VAAELTAASNVTRLISEICDRARWSWSSFMPKASASSPSVGDRFKVAASRETAASMRRALARTERGTQSRVRSSSRMFPLIRAIAYVSNWHPRAGSNRSTASMRPKMP
jgi:hypothetical protein